MTDNSIVKIKRLIPYLTDLTLDEDESAELTLCHESQLKLLDLFFLFITGLNIVYAEDKATERNCNRIMSGAVCVFTTRCRSDSISEVYQSESSSVSS